VAGLPSFIFKKWRDYTSLSLKSGGITLVLSLKSGGITLVLSLKSGGITLVLSCIGC
jgi:hypothetical protein